MNFNLPVSKKIMSSAQMFERVKDAVAKALDEESKKLLADIRGQMRAPKSGRWYGSHRASAPGEAPAEDSKKLINSLRARKSQEGLKVRISAEVGYAKLLEHGTPNGKIKKRPFMAPAKKKFEPIIKRRLESVVAKQIRERTK